MSDQCYGTQQISLVQTHTSSDRQDMAHPTAIESDPSRNARPNHTGTNKDGSSDQCNGIQKLSLAHDLLSLASFNGQKIASTIPIESYPSMKSKQNRIYTNNDLRALGHCPEPCSLQAVRPYELFCELNPICRPTIMAIFVIMLIHNVTNLMTMMLVMWRKMICC